MKMILEHITKIYNKKTVLNNFNYTFNNNLYIINGVNGVGKSTLIKIIYGIVKPTLGKIIFDGVISYLPEKYKIPNFITVEEYLNIINEIKGNLINKDLIDDYLNMFGILKYKKYKMKELSKGTIQKVMIINTLLDNADVFLFDEPINGLDSKSQDIFLYFLSELKNKIIIVCTHNIKLFNNINYINLEILESK